MTMKQFHAVTRQYGEAGTIVYGYWQDADNTRIRRRYGYIRLDAYGIEVERVVKDWRPSALTH